MPATSWDVRASQCERSDIKRDVKHPSSTACPCHLRIAIRAHVFARTDGTHAHAHNRRVMALLERCFAFGANRNASLFVGVSKLAAVLCQNCVRYPMKRRLNSVTYGDTPMDIVVAGSR